MSRTLPIEQQERDEYRFGDGTELTLCPGTVGWAADDLRDPQVRRLWDAGRYEIIEGVLSVLPAARFRGGMVVDNLKFMLHAYFHGRQIPCAFSGEVDVVIAPQRVVRADAAAVIGDDLAKFNALKFEELGTDWRDYPLSLPPTLIIESISLGHELHDARTKRRWYAAFGVKNYWIVDGYRKSL